MSEEASSSALWEAFHARTSGLGDRTAVSTPTEELSFDALWAEANRLASLFVRAGVVEGAVAALAVRNSPRFVTAFLALCRLDACVALLSPQYGPGELSAVVTGAGTACIVTDADAAPRIAAAVPIARSSAVGGLEVLIPADGEEGPAQSAALLKFSLDRRPADVVSGAALLFGRGGDRCMCDSSKWEYWKFLRDKERREDEAGRAFDVVDERDVPDAEVEDEPEPERELVRA
jgi:acyl-CoA synthetase (AMP-forming)/AMP-acid ligase II